MTDQIRELFQRIEELERRVGQMVVRGKIKEVDPSKALAKVEYGEGLATGWLPWKPIRTGKAIVWWVPEVGEGVTVISEGDLVLGEIYPGSYHSGFPAPSDDPDLFLVQFGEGSEISHNRADSKLTVINKGDVNVTADGAVTAKAKGSITVETEQTLTVKSASDMKLDSGGNMDLNASGNIKLSASRIDFN